MKVCQDIQSESACVNIEYCSTHTTHSKRLAHVPLPAETKEMIASKLLQGISIDKIMDSIRDEMSGHVYREHLTTRQDILNIKRQLNIGCIQKHTNDQSSVNAWVQDLNDASNDYSPILIFKSQGNDDCDTCLNKEDFLLGIQTKFQCDVMKKYCKDVICMDATHGTNAYDFLLITVLVVDEFGEGIPVAWAISNSEDTAHLVAFLTALKGKVGDIHTHVFMSDDAQQYFNAWSDVFGADNTKKLLCSWHVDRAWRKALNTHIPDKDDRVKVYHQLSVIMFETDLTAFREKLQQLLSFLSETHPSFSEYFNRQYAHRYPQWAGYNKADTIVNTNMFVESFHRLLKTVYLHSKQNRRIDHLLHVLLRIARDMAFGQLIKIEKGKLTHRRCEINKRHQLAVNTKDTYNITDGEDNTWIVTLQVDEQRSYTVMKQNIQCSCQLVCSHCGACIHMYTCSCIDATIHATVCKHAHMVHMSSINAVRVTEGEDNGVNGQDIEFATILTHQSTPQDIEKAKQALSHAIDELQVLITQSTSLDALRTAKGHLNTAVSVLKPGVCNSPHIPSTSKSPPNANMEKQVRFYSTKKPREPSSKVIRKPTPTEVAGAKEELRKVEVSICGVCLKCDDEDSEALVNWVTCTKCNLWVHKECSELVNNSPLCNTCTSLT